MKRLPTFLLRVLPLLLTLGNLPAEANAAEPVATMTDKARELYTEGTQAMNQSKFADAYASLRAAWALNQHYQIAAHLGRVEVELGNYADGATHLRFAKAEGEKAGLPKKDLDWVQKHLERALAELGLVRIKVEPPNAEVSIGGLVVDGKTRTEGIPVAPGRQVVSAQLAGYKKAEKPVDVAKGQQIEVTLTLEKESGVASGPKPGGPVATPPVQGTDGQDTFPRTELIWGGAAVGTALLAGGVVTFVLAGSAESDGDAIRDSIGTQDLSVCARPTAPSSCGEMSDNYASSDDYANVAVPLLITGGAVLAGTALYWMLTSDEESPRAQVAPTVTTEGAAIWVTGAF